MKGIGGYVQSVEHAASFLRNRIEHIPEIAIILGTGLSGLAADMKVRQEVSYSDIPGFPELTVRSHQGTLLVGTLADVPVLALNGRAHVYEGYSAKDVTFAIRVLGQLGVKTLLVSNACGGMDPEHKAGDILLIEDHINLMGVNPLEGPNHSDWGPRFPDMSDPYSLPLRELAHSKAREVGVSLHEGVYAAVVGPNLETRAEYRMLQRMGADVVGMSTVPEVLVARHMDMRVLAFSIITDECDPDNLAPISIEDVLAAAESASGSMRSLLAAIVPEL